MNESGIPRVIPVPKLAFSGFAPDTATVVYTFTASPGRGTGYGQIVSVDFVNKDSSDQSIRMAVIGAGLTITDTDWDLLDPQSSGLMTAGQKIYGTDDGKGLYMFNGDRIVLAASAPDVIACRIVVEESK